MFLISRKLVSSLLVVAGLFAFAAVHAEDAPATPLTKEQLLQLQALKQEGQQAQQRIGQLQKEAMEGDADLQQERDTLQGAAAEAMKGQGVDSEKQLARLKELRIEFSAEGTSDERKSVVQQEALEIQKQLTQAQNVVMSDAKVQEIAARLEKKLIAAMTKLDEGVPGMIKKMDDIENQIREIMMAAYSGK